MRTPFHFTSKQILSREDSISNQKGGNPIELNLGTVNPARSALSMMMGLGWESGLRVAVDDGPSLANG
jgi:hypothetical protein